MGRSYEQMDFATNPNQISDADASSWALWMLRDIASKDAQEREREAGVEWFVKTFLWWTDRIKMLNSWYQPLLYKDQDPQLLNLHKQMNRALMSIGDMISVALNGLPTNEKQTANRFVDENEIKTGLRNLEISYEEFHVSTPEKRKEDLLSILKAS